MGYLLYTISYYCNLALATIGHHLAFTQAGIFFLGVPVMWGVGGYSYVVAQNMGASGIVPFLCMLGLCLAVSLVYVAAYRYFSNDILAILTLASLLATESLIKSWTEVTGGVLGLPGVARPAFATSLNDILIVGLVMLAIAAALEFFIFKSRIGRSIRAMKEDTRTLESLGSNSVFLGSCLIVGCCMIASLSGMFYAWRLQFLDPSMVGIPVLVIVVTVAVLAQAPSVFAFLGSVLAVVAVPEALRFMNLPSEVVGQTRMIVYCLIVIILIAVISRKQRSLRSS